MRTRSPAFSASSDAFLPPTAIFVSFVVWAPTRSISFPSGTSATVPCVLGGQRCQTGECRRGCRLKPLLWPRSRRPWRRSSKRAVPEPEGRSPCHCAAQACAEKVSTAKGSSRRCRAAVGTRFLVHISPPVEHHPTVMGDRCTGQTLVSPKRLACAPSPSRRRGNRHSAPDRRWGDSSSQGECCVSRSLGARPAGRGHRLSARFPSPDRGAASRMR
jgi:hypothetical protein